MTTFDIKKQMILSMFKDNAASKYPINDLIVIQKEIAADLFKGKTEITEVTSIMLSLATGNIELFIKKFGNESSLDFVNSRLQWLDTEPSFSDSDIFEIIVSIQIELMELSINKRSSLSLKNITNLLNVIVFILDSHNLLEKD